MRKWYLWAVAFALVVAPAFAACPNKCSGHGKCELNDVCKCMQNWSGGDCSLRVCPYQRAWQDTPLGNTEAHMYAECSNRGTCNRETGICECDTGFTGSGCRRILCPSDCNGHGTCEYIEDLGKDSFDRRVGGAHSRQYSLWDQEKVMGCKCDPWYERHSCSNRMCPRGDDPLTPSQVEMVQAIVLPDAGSGYLTYFDPYGNAYTTDKITLTTAHAGNAATCTAIQTALHRLPNNVLNTVTVAAATTYYPFTRTSPTSDAGTIEAQFTSTDGTDHVCLVSFRSEPGQTGYQHLFECNMNAHNTVGQHPVTAGGTASQACTVKEAYVASGTITPGAGTRALTELAECSNRGTCDRATGICQCYTGHMGLACEKQEALV